MMKPILTHIVVEVDKPKTNGNYVVGIYSMGVILRETACLHEAQAWKKVLEVVDSRVAIYSFEEWRKIYNPN